MEGTVWVTEWQLRCCGDPFEVGTWVKWQVVPPDPDWLTDLLGAEVAATVVGMEERHDRVEEATPFDGRVRSIRAVTRAGLTEVADSDSDDDDDDVVGYLVEVTP